MMIPFQVTNWELLKETEIDGDSGSAKIKFLELGDTIIRQVEYSENYIADHWCAKGHIAYCISGELTIELVDNSKYNLKKGMTFQVSDNLSYHRAYTKVGAKLFIIDGAF